MNKRDSIIFPIVVVLALAGLSARAAVIPGPAAIKAVSGGSAPTCDTEAATQYPSTTGSSNNQSYDYLGSAVTIGGSNITVCAISFALARVGSPSETATFAIWSDDSMAGLPEVTGTPIAETVASLDCDVDLTTSEAEYKLELATPVELTASTTYWGVVHFSATGDGSNHCLVYRGTDSGNERAISTDPSSSWSSFGSDTAYKFKLFSE